MLNLMSMGFFGRFWNIIIFVFFGLLLYSFLAAYKTNLRAKQSQTLYENLRNKRTLSPYDDAHIYLLEGP